MKESAIFAQVNSWSEEEVAAIVGLELARDGKSYVCPFCGHGKGGNGIKPEVRRNGHVNWWCPCCEEPNNWSNADLIAKVGGVDILDAAAVARYLEERYYPEKQTPFLSFGQNYSEEPARRTSEKVAAVEEAKDWTKLYYWCELNHPLKELIPIGGTWRGLTYETLKHFGAKYHPEFWFNEKKGAVLFPYDNNLTKSPAQAGDAVLSGHQQVLGDQRSGFFWRSVAGQARGFSRGSRIVAPYVASALKTPEVGSYAVNFVFEGIIDALSCFQAVRASTGDFEWLKDVGLLAMGSAKFAGIFSRWVMTNYGGAAQKPSFCIVADNDFAGIEAAGDLWRKLSTKGFPTALKQFAKYGSPKMDANDVLQEYGAEKLFSVLAAWKAKIGGR